MNTITVEEAEAHLRETIEQTCAQHLPIIIERKNGDPVIMLPLKDYCAAVLDAGIPETLYLTSTRANTASLLKSIEQAKQGNLIFPSPSVFEEEE